MSLKILAELTNVSEKDMHSFLFGVQAFIKSRNIEDKVLSGEISMHDVVVKYSENFEKISLRFLKEISTEEERSRDSWYESEWLNDLYDKMYKDIMEAEK